jgi:hypothetical protein
MGATLPRRPPLGKGWQDFGWLDSIRPFKPSDTYLAELQSPLNALTILESFLKETLTSQLHSI